MEPVILSSLEGLELLLEAEGDSRLRAAQKMLVGRLITDKSLNKSVVKEILAKAWGLNEELNISDLGPNVFLFNFNEAREARRVLDEGMWYVMGCLLSLQSWIPEASVHEVNYDYVGFWVQLHGLPLEFMSTSNAVKIRPRYGPSLGVPQAKSLATIAAENSMRIKRLKNGKDDDVSQERAEPDTSRAQSGQPTTGTCKGQGAKEGAKSEEGLTADSVGPKRHTEATFLSDSVVHNNPLNEDILRGTKGKTIQGTTMGHNPPNPKCLASTSSSQVNSHLPYVSICCVDLEEESVIIQDYPSPTLKGTSSYGLSLSIKDIEVCRNSWLLAQTEKSSDRGSKSMESGPEIPILVLPQQTLNRPEYYVQFLPEDPQDNDPCQTVVKNITEDFKKIVNLKRGRSGNQLYLTTGENDGGVSETASYKMPRFFDEGVFPLVANIFPQFADCSRAEESGKVESLKRTLRYKSMFCVDPRGLSRGLCLLWDNTVEVEPLRNAPWSLLGDFNEILHLHEKEGIRPPNTANMHKFREFVSEVGLMDFDLKGSSFTWFSNPRQGGGNDDAGSWNSFLKNTRRCRRAISTWQKATFKNAAKEIAKLKARLLEIQNGYRGDEDWEEMQEIRTRLSRLWKQEEQY
ncbi:hypothetical protein SESBI_49621 [Sesbania bispinosa]|nr:hypothetical protein SESBI_49621 [Sesbania bispinosa]